MIPVARKPDAREVARHGERVPAGTFRGGLLQLARVIVLEGPLPERDGACDLAGKWLRTRREDQGKSRMVGVVSGRIASGIHHNRRHST